MEPDDIWPSAHSKFDWRNTREVAFGVQLWPMVWLHWLRWSVRHDNDAFGGVSTLNLGPLVLTLTYNVGEANVARIARERGL